MTGFVRGLLQYASASPYTFREVVWYVHDHYYRFSINALSFSHDGEYLAIANAGTYIDIVRLLSSFHFCLASDLFEVCYRNEHSTPSSSCLGSFSDCDMASIKVCYCILWTNEAEGRWSCPCCCYQHVWLA